MALRRSMDRMYLHCRTKDEPAKLLYGAGGYAAVATDIWGIQFLPGQNRRILMTRRLDSDDRN